MPGRWDFGSGEAHSGGLRDSFTPKAEEKAKDQPAAPSGGQKAKQPIAKVPGPESGENLPGISLRP